MKGWLKRKIKTVSREIFWRCCDFRRNLWNFPGRINGMFTGESRAPKKKVKQWHFRFLTKASFLETLILLSNRVVQSMVEFNIQLHLIFRDGKIQKFKEKCRKKFENGYRNLRGIFKIFSLQTKVNFFTIFWRIERRFTFAPNHDKKKVRKTLVRCCIVKIFNFFWATTDHFYAIRKVMPALTHDASLKSFTLAKQLKFFKNWFSIYRDSFICFLK